jgi:hypothetical protein
MDQQVAPTKKNTKRTLCHLLPASKAPPPQKKRQRLSLSPRFHLVHLLMILPCHWHLSIEHQ